MNLTGLYDILLELSEDLRTTKQQLEAVKLRQLETEEELDAT